MGITTIIGRLSRLVFVPLLFRTFVGSDTWQVSLPRSRMSKGSESEDPSEVATMEVRR